jgi:hypothetical protein
MSAAWSGWTRCPVHGTDLNTAGRCAACDATPARPAGGEPSELLMENGEREVLERVIARLDRKALLMPFVKLDVGAFDGHGRLDVEQTRANLLAWLCAAHGGSETMGKNTERQPRWYGHAAHFICGRWCRFHLATEVNGYLVSTVGEYWPERQVREIYAEVCDPAWLVENAHRKGDDFDRAYLQRFGYEDIGYERKYETMVFRAGEPCTAEGCNCGPPTIDGSELDFEGYNTAGAATAGHMAMIEKWSARPAGEARDDG